MDKILELVNKLNEIKQELEELKKAKENEEWKPKNDEKYFYVDSSGFVNCAYFDNAFSGHRYRLETKNCFQTSDEARKHLEAIKTKAELRTLADSFDNRYKVDVETLFLSKFLISLRDGLYSFEDDFKELAIEQIGKERLIEMIKAGV